MPPRKIHPSADLAAVAQDDVCAPDSAGVVAVGGAVGVRRRRRQSATIGGGVGAGVEADSSPVGVWLRRRKHRHRAERRVDLADLVVVGNEVGLIQQLQLS